MKLVATCVLRVNGRDYKKGDVLDVGEATGKTLLENGWAKKPDKKKAKK